MAKKSYTVFCASSFRDAVEQLAANQNASLADLAQSVLLLMSQDQVGALPDPGEPDLSDRETVVLKSGPSKGRKMRRKPRLQLRMNADYTPPLIRKALGLMLAMNDNRYQIKIENMLVGNSEEKVKDLSDKNMRLHNIVHALSFTPLRNGVQTTQEALYVLGFSPNEHPPKRLVREKFKMLAMIYHPDSPYAGDNTRMAQLNEAVKFLS